MASIRKALGLSVLGVMLAGAVAAPFVVERNHDRADIINHDRADIINHDRAEIINHERTAEIVNHDRN